MPPTERVLTGEEIAAWWPHEMFLAHLPGRSCTKCVPIKCHDCDGMAHYRTTGAKVVQLVAWCEECRLEFYPTAQEVKEQQEATIRALETERERLRGYAWHKYACRFLTPPDFPPQEKDCNCGLSAALSSSAAQEGEGA